MKKNICMIIVLGATLIMASCSSSTPQTSTVASVVPQLFTLQPTQNRQMLQKTAKDHLKTLLADPANEEFTLVNVDASLIGGNTENIAITLPNRKAEKFNRRNFSVLADGYEGWVGYQPSKWKAGRSGAEAEIDFDPEYYMSIIRLGNQLAGNFLVDGQRYRLVYIGSDTHVLIKVDESKLPSEDALGVDVGFPASPALEESQQVSSAYSIIRLLFVSTVQSRAKNPNYRADLMLGLQDVNQIAKNSKVDITYEFAGFIDSAIDEVGKDFGTLLNEVQYNNPAVNAKRVELRADLVSMYVANSEFCGAGKPSSNKTQGFSAINCITSLAHEIGHNFGMTHNWDGQSDNYIHGYRYAPDGGNLRFRTQMSANCSPTCPRVPFYSNPRLSYQGQPLGTVAHHDVARAINERRASIESFYPPMPGVLKNKGRLDQGSTHPCLQDFAGSSIQFVACSPGPQQKWTLEPWGEAGTFRIVAPGGKCMVARADNYVLAESCPATVKDGLLWMVSAQPDHTLKIQSYNRNLCLGSQPSLKPGPELLTCDNGRYQSWINLDIPQ
ncbi:reprolysin-like metallopeptidase [Pseudomonas putida]|uniref:reprolysin-like metallopeptidase n=1 Tax=Pseudomonas putida TaxID=303 RepID=UPI00226541DD